MVLLFKDQVSVDILKEQLKELSLKVNTTIQPVFASRKIEPELNVNEAKPPIVNWQCAVYNFQCNLRDAGYVGYTHGHLNTRVKGHEQQTALRHCQTLQERALDDPQGPAETFRSA